MKKFKDIPIRIKLPLLIGCVMLIVLAIVSVIQVRMVRSTARENAIRLMRMEALSLGNQLAEQINSPGSVVRAFSGIMEEMTHNTLVEQGKKRELLYREMEILIKDEP